LLTETDVGNAIPKQKKGRERKQHPKKHVNDKPTRLKIHSKMRRAHELRGMWGGDRISRKIK